MELRNVDILCNGKLIKKCLHTSILCKQIYSLEFFYVYIYDKIVIVHKFII